MRSHRSDQRPPGKTPEGVPKSSVYKYVAAAGRNFTVLGSTGGSMCVLLLVVLGGNLCFFCFFFFSKTSANGQRGTVRWTSDDSPDYVSEGDWKYVRTRRSWALIVQNHCVLGHHSALQTLDMAKAQKGASFQIIPLLTSSFSSIEPYAVKAVGTPYTEPTRLTQH